MPEVERTYEEPYALGFWQHEMETVDFSVIELWIKELEEKWGRKLNYLEITKHRKSPGFRAFVIITPEGKAENAES